MTSRGTGEGLQQDAGAGRLSRGPHNAIQQAGDSKVLGFTVSQRWGRRKSAVKVSLGLIQLLVAPMPRGLGLSPCTLGLCGHTASPLFFCVPTRLSFLLETHPPLDPGLTPGEIRDSSHWQGRHVQRQSQGRAWWTGTWGTLLKPAQD